MSEAQTAEILCQISLTKLVQLKNSELKVLVEDDVLKVGKLNQQNLTFLNISHIYHTLQKDQKFVIKEFQTQVSVYFQDQNDDGWFVLILNNNYMQEIKTLQSILDKSIHLITPDQVLSDEKLVQHINIHYPTIFDKPLVEENQVQQIIQQSGQVLKSGFQFVGGWIGKGIQSGSNFISQKINPNEQETTLTEEQKDKLNSAKEKAKKTMQVSSQYFNMIYAPLKQKVIDPLAEKATNLKNEAGQKIDESDSKILKGAKNITKTTIGATKEAFSGLTTGASEVGHQISENSKMLVEKKYGDKLIKDIKGDENKDKNELGNIEQPSFD